VEGSQRVALELGGKLFGVATQTLNIERGEDIIYGVKSQTVAIVPNFPAVTNLR
jgi:hypothetical protein